LGTLSLIGIGSKTKNGIFGIYAIIDQILLRIPLLPIVRKIKGKFILESPNPPLTNKIKIFIQGVHRTA
jgi:hypothetical protein